MRYAVFLGLLAFFGLLRLFFKCNATKNQRKFYILLCGVVLFAFAVSRGTDFTSDVTLYAEQYARLRNANISFYWQQFLSGDGKDVTYTILATAFSKAGISFRVFTALISVFYFTVLCRFVYLYSKEPYFSFIIYIMLGHYYFSLTAIRQSIAIALVLLSFDYILRKKPIRFGFCVAIASLFHLSALLFLLAYPLSKLKMRPLYVLSIPFLYLFARMTAQTFMSRWSEFAPEQYQVYEELETVLSLTGFLIMSCICVFCLLYGRKPLQSNAVLNVSVVLCLFSLLPYAYSSFMFAEMFRISNYFGIFTVLAIPNIVMKTPSTVKYQRAIVYSGLLAVFTAYFFLSSNSGFIQFF